MNEAEWSRVKGVVERASALPEEARAEFLSDACGEDENLRREVEALLRVPEEALGFLDRLQFRLDEESSPPGHLEPGDRLGGVEIVERLEQGGMGAVYLAEDEGHCRRVAVKVVRSSAGAVPEREKRILGRLNHGSIARLYESGVTPEGADYFVMEHVEGLPLDAYCDERRLGVRERLQLFRKVCSAVEYAHGHQVVHRDLKPANILVRADGEPKLLDFGISKLLDPDEELPPTATVTGRRAMTPAFASPEQVLGHWTATASDIYSLGVVLYLVLTGRLPYGVGSEHELFWAIAEVEAERASRAVLRSDTRLGPSGLVDAEDAEALARSRGTTPKGLSRALRGDLDAILLKALRKEPERRYRTVSELSEDLQHVLENEPVGARRGSGLYRAGKFTRRHRWAVAVVAGLFAMNLGTSVALYLAQRATSKARAAAEGAADEARSELRRAQEVRSLLVETFNASNPERQKGEKESVEDLLARGRERLAEPGLSPELRAELGQTVALAYKGQGLYAEGAELLEGILPETEKATGADSRSSADVMKILGNLERQRGHLARSEEVLRAALAIYRRQAPEGSVEVANTDTQLALTLQKAGKLDEAVGFAREGIGLIQKLGDPNDLLPAARSNLGLMLSRQGKTKEAEKVERQVVSDYARIMGRKHINYGKALNNLGTTLVAEGEFAEATKVLLEASQIYRDRLGPNHPEALVNLNNLAAAAYYAGQYDTAVKTQTEVVQRMLAVQEPGHPNAIAMVENLGMFERGAGDLQGARKTLEGVLAIAREKLGAGHWLTGQAAYRLAAVRLEQGDAGAANPLFAEAVRAFDGSLGAGSWRAASAKLEWSLALEELGQTERGETLSREGLVELRASEGPENWRTAAGESERGELLLRTGRPADAEPLLLHAYQVLLAKRGAKILETQIAARRIEKLYTALGEPNKARVILASRAPK